jgi:hypothetical protein
LETSEFGDSEREVPCAPKYARFWRHPWYSLLPFSPGDVFVDINGPDPTPGQINVVASGFAERPTAAAVDTSVARSIVDSTLRVVSASDGPEWALGQSMGAVLSRSTRQVTASIRSDANGIATLSSFEQLALRSAPTPQASGKIVAAASGRRQNVAIFDDRDSAGELQRRVRIVDLESGNSMIKPLFGDVVPENPVAVTYRAQDDAYYLIDVVAPVRGNAGNARNDRAYGAGLTRVLRIGDDWMPAVVGSWRTHAEVRDYGMTTSADGSLVITTSLRGAWRQTADDRCDDDDDDNDRRAGVSARADQHCVVQLAVSDDFQTLTGVRRWKGPGLFDLPAFLSAGGRIGMTVMLNGEPVFNQKTAREGRRMNVRGAGRCF